MATIGKGRVIGNQGFSIIDPGITESELEDIELLESDAGPDELEEIERADLIDAVADINLRNDKKKHDDYEEEQDALMDEIDKRYDGLC